jgi:hypothetical protein
MTTESRHLGWLTRCLGVAVAVGLFSGSAVAHAAHGGLHTLEGQLSVAVLGLAGVALLTGALQLYAEDAVSVRGAGIGATLGGSLLLSAALLVWPVV